MTSRVIRPLVIGRVRLASVDDAPIIMELVNESMAMNFRVHDTPDIVYLIENCVLSICQLDVSEGIIGFLAARDYPLIPSVHPQAWEEYLWTKYKAVELNSRNTLFINLLCWKPDYGRETVDSLLKSMFMHDPYLQHIAMTKSLVNYPLLMPGQARTEASFRRVNASEKGVPGDQLPALCIADRTEVSPRLRIRRAVEEDNDDIVPIIEAHSQRLREIYGEFYVSELISRHPESERVLLVCEHKEVAVGVMCLNTQINFETLEENFELSPFSGLRKLDRPPVYKRSKEIDSNVSFSASAANQVSETSPGASYFADLSRGGEGKNSTVTWVFEDDEFKVYHETPTGVHSAQLDILQLLEEDEDELEYDIINIDTDLLRVPKLLSYETLDTYPTENIKKILDGFRKEPVVEEKKKEKSKTVQATCNNNKTVPEPTRYSGVSNAFLIELFAMHHDYDERYGFDMLEVAYELFPNRDYCIISLPTNQTSFPLLEHFTLVTPYNSRMRFINDSLYVAHVNSIRGDLKVRPGEAYDISVMFDICEHSPRAQGLIDLFESCLSSYTLQCFVMCSQNQPVGMVVLGPLEDGASVRTQYDLEPEPRRPGTDGMVVLGVVSPVVEPHSRWFMRELLRLSQYSTLFWVCRLFAKGDSSPNKHLMSLAGYMSPVHPRRLVPNMSGNKDLDKIFRDNISIPFALWVLERPLSSLPKVYVNNSIVVVGASRTGLAFLETLLLGPTSQYLTFSNVTLVSEHGIPTVTECLRAADTCVPRHGRYTDRYLKSVPFYFYLDVMSAVMVGIDRKKKCIHLKGGGVKFYDELVITCGQQFQHPDYLHGPFQLVKEIEQGKPCERILMDDPKYQPDRVSQSPDTPENVMLINSLFEANICMRKLLRMISDSKDSSRCLSVNRPVIVYGDCIEAYSCIAALLELGIFAEKITFVEPFPPDDHTQLRVNCFNNEFVDERVQATLENIGIRILRKSYLAGWEQHDVYVESINLMSPIQTMSLPCFALFYYGLKAIDVAAFRAINDSGLVYDGGLVVGPLFETNDPNVFGAGTCVKYSRKLYAGPRGHKHYCSEDVGEALAKLFLKKLDPFVMGTDLETDSLPRYGSSLMAWQPVINFKSPIVQSATLPGPCYYLKIRKPGIEIPMEVQLSLPHQGHILVTDKHSNYFRLQLNVLHCIDSVTCLSKKPFCSETLSQAYGKHESIFNKLLTRFKMGLIDDLYEFFTEPWLSALYQEPFQDLLTDINDQDIATVHDLMKSRYSLYETDTKLSSISRAADVSKSFKDARRLGTFRSVIDRFVARKSSAHIVEAPKPTDIPSECGQSAAIRGDSAGFWQTIGGERIVIKHLANYLNRNSVNNPHYAVPGPEYI